MTPRTHLTRIAFLTAVALVLPALAFLPAPATYAAWTAGGNANALLEIVIPEPRTCAMWANSTTHEETFRVTGSENHLRTCIHSNRDMWYGGGANSANGTLRYVNAFTLANSNVVASGSVKVSPGPYPFPFHVADFAPGSAVAIGETAKGKYFVYVGPVTLKAADLAKGGVHYIHGSADVSVRDFTGNVTIVATDSLTIAAKNSTLKGYRAGLLFGAYGQGTTKDPAFTVASESSTFRGHIHVPVGELKVSGNGHTFDGHLSGDRIHLQGNSNRFTGLDPYSV